jgi:hypothetical protein
VRRALLALVLVCGAAVSSEAAAAPVPAQATGYAYGVRANATLVAARLAAAPSGFTGGPVTASDGEVVNVYVQDELLAADPTAGQKWADILTGLVHGAELSSLTVYIATLDQVTQTCGSGALGCYANNRLIAIGQDYRGLSARAVVTHEYGHHVANNRDNAPWQAVDYGTKRWATYVGVCRRTKSGELAPGDESSRYTFNPGEALAEDYRLLNERRLGLPESPWAVVDDSFYPDQTALDLLALDVTSSWTGNTSASYAGSVTTRSSGRGFTVATPLDGSFSVTLTSPRAARLTLRLVDPATHKVLASSTGTARVKSLAAEVCGQRTLQVQVKRVKGGAGAFTLAVSKP